MSSVNTALRVRGLSVSFHLDGGPVEAVRHVDLDVPRGQLVALLGESGSGKSVTARAVMGLAGQGATVTADELTLGDTDLRTVSPGQLRELRGTRMSLVLQDALSALNPVLTIGDQLGELFRVHRGASKKAARARAVDLLGMVGIPAPARRVDDYPHQFSGGMRQRILIAMAIALEPELLIADEPTTALDVTVQAQILDLLGELRSQLDMGVLLITHDLAVVSEVADQLAVMYAGRVVEAGDADTVLNRPGHPYTEALLSAVPDPDPNVADRAKADGRGRIVLRGEVADPSKVPAGCPFHPRCFYAQDRCRTEVPALREVRPGRRAACHFAEELELRGIEPNAH